MTHLSYPYSSDLVCRLYLVHNLNHQIQLLDHSHEKALASLDLLSLRTKVTSVRATIATLRTDAEKLRSTLEGYVAERRRRGEEIARFRGVMREIQVWLNGAKAKTATEIKLYSLGDVQRAIDVIEVRVMYSYAFKYDFTGDVPRGGRKQKSRRIGCVIPHCNLQHEITQPILRLFLTYLYYRFCRHCL